MSKAWVSMILMAGCCAAVAAPLVLAPADGVQGKDKITAQAGIDVLLKSCPALARYGDDLKSTGAKPREARMAEQRDLGWESAVEIQLVVVDRPQRIPLEYKASGHHCYFDVSPAGKNAGVTISKRPCIAICQGEVEQLNLPNGYKFIPAR
ncbi:hypothetical protein DLREEDagrD3_28900 [Denitratisoma sp. agr-D3]